MTRVARGDGGGPRVLIVEDHAILREALTITLGLNGPVTAAHDLSPDAVLALAEEFKPDVVLLDFYLGEGDSLPLIPGLVKIAGCVVMLTGTTDDRLLGECIAAGAAGIVFKGSDFDELVATVQAAASGGEILSLRRREELLEAARSGRAEDANRLRMFESLTGRERQVLVHLLEGMSAEEIGRIEYVSLATIRSQIRGILMKLGVNTQLAAVALARKANWPN